MQSRKGARRNIKNQSIYAFEALAFGGGKISTDPPSVVDPDVWAPIDLSSLHGVIIVWFVFDLSTFLVEFVSASLYCSQNFVPAFRRK